MKQYLDKEQSQQLIDSGVDMSNSLLVDCKYVGIISRSGLTDEISSYGYTPTYTIGEMIQLVTELDLSKSGKKPNIRIEYDSNGDRQIRVFNTVTFSQTEELIDYLHRQYLHQKEFEQNY